MTVWWWGRGSRCQHNDACRWGTLARQAGWSPKPARAPLVHAGEADRAPAGCGGTASEVRTLWAVGLGPATMQLALGCWRRRRVGGWLAQPLRVPGLTLGRDWSKRVPFALIRLASPSSMLPAGNCMHKRDASFACPAGQLAGCAAPSACPALSWGTCMHAHLLLLGTVAKSPRPDVAPLPRCHMLQDCRHWPLRKHAAVTASHAQSQPRWQRWAKPAATCMAVCYHDVKVPCMPISSWGSSCAAARNAVLNSNSRAHSRVLCEQRRKHSRSELMKACI